MKFETLRNNRKILLGTVIVFVVILTLIISTSLAKYKVTESIYIASGTINYSPSDLNLMAVYLEGDSGYTQSDTIPESGYTLNNDESYCKVGDSNVDVTISYDFDTKALSITPMTQKGTKCYLYFDVSYCPTEAAACEKIMANMTTITERSSNLNPLWETVTASSTGILYKAADDDGTSYYYAGAPTDNWVKFAGLYWRIVRINGDGTIRLIYNGTSTTTTGTGTQISTSAFNSNYNQAEYVGYMYTEGTVHGLGTSSTIKGVLENWYVSKLVNYASYIDTNAGFCGDRRPSTTSSYLNGSGGTGTTNTYYAAYNKLIIGYVPVLTCANSSDLYTVSGSSKGNKVLTYPIGLITADEVHYAGGVYGSSSTNKSYYLYTGKDFWTISPCIYYSGRAYVVYVTSNGYLSDYGGVDFTTYGVRPVINLRADVTLNGSGTSTDPYIVS